MNYWKSRFDAIEQNANTSATAFNRKLNRDFKRAEKTINEKIDSWYNRIAVNNKISPADARAFLSNSELKDFKLTLEEYIELSRKCDPKWQKVLENASAKVHIQRLEAMKLEARHQIEMLMPNYQYGMNDLLYRVYEDSYYRSLFEIQKGNDIAFSVAKLDKNVIKQVLSKPWAPDGTRFSDRIWTNKTKLVNTLNNEITRLCLTGEKPDNVIRNIANTMNTSLSNAQRLVYTEQAYFTTRAECDSYSELGVDEYEIIATLDNVTCDDCGAFDGQHYSVKDLTVGVNAPPFHPNCRCTTAPCFDDNFGLRASREDDKTVQVYPENMTYCEWKNRFVEDDIFNVDALKSENDALWAKYDAGDTSVLPKIYENVDKTGEHYLNDVKTDITDKIQPILDEVESLRAHNAELTKQFSELRDKKYKDLIDADEFKKSRDVLRNEQNELIRKASELTDSAKHKCSELMSEKIKSVRSIGIDEDTLKKHIQSRSSVKSLVYEAIQKYPTDWLKKSSEGTITLKKVKRGYYSGGLKDAEIAISENGGLRCAFHELGHRFETINPHILAMEKHFYEKRTAGEKLERMVGYSAKELTRKDHFISPYMGKDYGGRAYELVSMGFQYAYTDTKTLMQDEDFARFIIGALMLL